MRQLLGRGVLLAAAVLAVGAMAAWPQPPKPAQPAASCAERAAALAAKLTQPVTVDQPIENVTLKEALQFFQEKFDLPVLVNYQALGSAAPGMLAVVADNPIDNQTVNIPKVKGVRLGTLLTFVARQINATWMIRCDHVELTTAEQRYLDAGNWPKDPDEYPPAARLANLKLVCLSEKERPLSEVLAKLADQSESTILVAPAAAEKARRPVSVELVNVPLESAVQMLADMADLYVMPRDNAFYVTTPERAAAFEREQFEKQRRQMSLVPNVAGGTGFGGGLGALGVGGGAAGNTGPAPGAPVGLSGLATTPSGPAAEQQRQVEELRRELEELRKQIKKPAGGSSK